MYEPLFLLEENDRKKALHCCYTLSSDETQILATITDDHGELFENFSITIAGLSLKSILKVIWDYCRQLEENFTFFYPLVIGKLGNLFNQEVECKSRVCSSRTNHLQTFFSPSNIQGWKEILNEETNPLYQGSDVHLVSLLHNRSLQFIPSSSRDHSNSLWSLSIPPILSKKRSDTFSQIRFTVPKIIHLYSP